MLKQTTSLPEMRPVKKLKKVNLQMTGVFLLGWVVGVFWKKGVVVLFLFSWFLVCFYNFFLRGGKVIFTVEYILF